MWGKKVRQIARAFKRNEALRNLFIVVGLLLLISSLVLGSVVGNVYLHEFAHYSVAQHYDLEPEMHINNVISMDGFKKIRFNTNPVAYTTFTNPHDDRINFQVTFAGPLMNILLSVSLLFIYVVFRFIINKKIKYFVKCDRVRYALKWNTFRFIFDVIFISLIVPSLVAAFVNLSTVPGSDGEALRAIFSRM